MGLAVSLDKLEDSAVLLDAVDLVALESEFRAGRYISVARLIDDRMVNAIEPDAHARVRLAVKVDL